MPSTSWTEGGKKGEEYEGRLMEKKVAHLVLSATTGEFVDRVKTAVPQRK